MVARFLPHTDAVNKITIIPRGRAAGVTWFLPEERDFKYKDQLEAELAIAFGGRVAEELVFDRISTGASNDIKKATELAQQMIRSWGMSETLGPLSFAKDEEQVFLGREIAQHRDYSEETARKIDAEVNMLVVQAYERARLVLTDHLDVLHKLAEELLERETVLGAELDAIIREVRPGIQLPEKPSDKEEPPEGEGGGEMVDLTALTDAVSGQAMCFAEQMEMEPEPLFLGAHLEENQKPSKNLEENQRRP